MSKRISNPPAPGNTNKGRNPSTNGVNGSVNNTPTYRRPEPPPSPPPAPKKD